ncbi:hypothetical protein DSP50_25620 [Salmonella enterica]|nr:hypothetical protein [Salmonella enterica]
MTITAFRFLGNWESIVAPLYESIMRNDTPPPIITRISVLDRFVKSAFAVVLSFGGHTPPPFSVHAEPDRPVAETPYPLPALTGWPLPSHNFTSVWPGTTKCEADRFTRQMWTCG